MMKLNRAFEEPAKSLSSGPGPLAARSALSTSVILSSVLRLWLRAGLRRKETGFY
jgi:hypothetical protein